MKKAKDKKRTRRNMTIAMMKGKSDCTCTLNGDVGLVINGEECI